MELESKEETKKEVRFITERKILIVVVLLLALLALAWYIRTANVHNLKDITTGDYTLGPDLDPFLFLRYAKYIVANGKLMENDEMRYVPLGYETAKETMLLPYMIAYFHIILSKFSNVSINYSAVIFPAFMFLLTAVAFFLFIRKVFDKHKEIIGLVATAFLIASPSILSRTVAGIPEKESVGFFFMFLAFYFFLSAWKSENLKKGLIFASLAGISTGLMGLVWGGVMYVFFGIALSVFLEFVFGKTNGKRTIVFGLWIFFSIFMIIFFSERFALMQMVASASSGFGLAVFLLLLIDLFIFNTKIKDSRFIENLRKKLPDKVISISLGVMAIIILSGFLFGITFIPDLFSRVIESLSVPYTDRLSLTVAENRQPYFDEWKDSFGPLVKGVPLYFWLFFLGSVLFFYDILNIEKKGRTLLTLSYAVFLFGLIFSRYSSSSVMSGANNLSKIVYFGSFLVLIFSSCYVYYKNYKNNALEEFKKTNSIYIFLLVFFLVSIIGARSAVRLIMVLVPPSAGIVGYFSVRVYEKTIEEKNEKIKFVLSIFAVIIILISLYSFYYGYKATLGSAKTMIPSVYTQQWQKAMMWVRENTDKKAVFSHWWDYGYWLQSIGERASVLDGGNAIGYWNHLFGRHVLTGETEKEALEFLYAHNVSYLLIDSTEIGKYSAYSSIGSDENYDRYSWIGTFLLDETATEERKNETFLVYRGGAVLDENFVFKQEERQVFLPAGGAGVGAIILTQAEDQNLKQPEAIFVYSGKQYRIPLRYLYYKEKLYDFQRGYGGALYIMPVFIQERGLNSLGAALFLSERNMRALWVRLYLLGEGENFKIVHKQDDFVIENLRNQGATIRDFIYLNGIRGPIKIWKVNYPSDIKFKEEYLDIYGPESVMMAKT